MKVITKIAVKSEEGWSSSFEVIQSQDALDYISTLPKKGELAVAFYVEAEVDMPNGWAVAITEITDRRGEVHRTPERTSAGLLRVYKPSVKTPATVESLRALYGQK